MVKIVSSKQPGDWEMLKAFHSVIRHHDRTGNITRYFCIPPWSERFLEIYEDNLPEGFEVEYVKKDDEGYVEVMLRRVLNG